MEQQNQQPNQLNIEISEEVAEGDYANLAIITHSHAEFVIDFVNVMPGHPSTWQEQPGKPWPIVGKRPYEGERCG